MNDNLNKPAFSVQELNGQGLPLMRAEFGLSKMELIAGMLMQGLLSNLADIRKEGFKDKDLVQFAAIKSKELLEYVDENDSQQNLEQKLEKAKLALDNIAKLYETMVDLHSLDRRFYDAHCIARQTLDLIK